MAPYRKDAHVSPEYVALGITDEQDLLELKGTKKKKGKKIDDPDFMVRWPPSSYFVYS